MTSGFKNPVCRGSWVFGNNCKVCERCIATHPGRASTPSDLSPHALIEMEIKAPASEIPELAQANLIECLRYSAFKLCGKGMQEDYASDAMSMAIAEIERLREAIGDIKEAWNWWNVDTYDRCAGVVDDAIRAALGEKNADPQI